MTKKNLKKKKIMKIFWILMDKKDKSQKKIIQIIILLGEKNYLQILMILITDFWEI